MSGVENLSAKYKEMNPSKKRILVVAVTVLVFVGVFLVVSQEPEKVKKAVKKPIRTIFTEQNTREIGMDALSAHAKTLRRDGNLLIKRMGGLETRMDAIQQTINDAKTFNDKLRALQEQVKTLKTENQQLKKENAETKSLIPEAISKAVAKGVVGVPGSQSAAGSNSGERPQVHKEISDDEAARIFEEAELPDEEVTELPAPGQPGDPKQPVPKKITIQTYSQPKAESLSKKDKQEKDGTVYMPAGSIVTGTLINGMDAPTSTSAKKNPFPSTIRIQKEAILPNRFTADIRECFLVVSGFGDLSSERVYLRGEALSCITKDGAIIESRLESYAIGEDGKAGLRGRVVDKQGQIIARSLTAGFAGSLSEAFNANPVPSLATNVSGSTPYQNAFSGQALQGGLAKGTGKALDRIAQFYIEMAENIFPVVEIDAGREVEMILTRGTALSVKGKKKSADNINQDNTAG